jgi:hypothetical protein
VRRRRSLLFQSFDAPSGLLVCCLTNKGSSARSSDPAADLACLGVSSVSLSSERRRETRVDLVNMEHAWRRSSRPPYLWYRRY